MTTRIFALGIALGLLAGCNALKLVSGDRAGLPCTVEQGCGEGYACVDGACVKGAADGGTPDGSAGDAAGRDSLIPDVVIPDSTSMPPWDLTVTGTGFGVLNSTQVVGVLLDGNGVIDGTVVSAIGNFGTFTLSWTAVLQPATSYRVHFYFDLNGNGTCESDLPPPEPSEMGFNLTVGVVTGPRSITVTSGSGAVPTNVCASFDDVTGDAGVDGGSGPYDLIVNGIDFDGRSGQTLYFELYAGNPPVLQAADSLVLTQPSFTHVLAGVLDGSQEYALSWWFELDGVSSCTQDDLGGLAYLATPAADTPVSISGMDGATYGCLSPCDMDKDGVASTAASCGGADCDDDCANCYPGGTEICGNGFDEDCAGGVDQGCDWLDLHLLISGFTPNSAYELLLYNSADPGAPEGARVSNTLDAAGNDEVNLADIFVPGNPYTLLLFLDDGDAVCTIPPDSAYLNDMGMPTQDVNLTLYIGNCATADCTTVEDLGLAGAPDAGVPDDGGVPDGADAGACDPDAGMPCEKWLLRSAVDGGFTLSVSQRDCQNPVELCADCLEGVFSPDGQKVLIGVNPAADSSTDFWLVDLTTSPWTPTDLTLRGNSARWLDDTSFVYVVGTGCGVADLYEIRHHGLDPVTDNLLVGGLHAVGGGFVVTPDLNYLAHSEQTSACWSPSAVIRINNPAQTPGITPIWSENDHVDEPIALLQDGSGFLAQTMTSYSPPSSIRIVAWDGTESTLYSQLVDSVSGWVGAPGCITRQRLGPSGQFYCNASPGDGPVHRLDLSGSTPAVVPCEVNGKGASIEDVWEP